MKIDLRDAEQRVQRVAVEAYARERLEPKWYAYAISLGVMLCSMTIGVVGANWLDGPVVAVTLLCGLAAATPPLALQVIRLRRCVAALRDLQAIKTAG